MFRFYYPTKSNPSHNFKLSWNLFFGGKIYLSNALNAFTTSFQLKIKYNNRKVILCRHFKPNNWSKTTFLSDILLNESIGFNFLVKSSFLLIKQTKARFLSTLVRISKYVESVC